MTAVQNPIEIALVVGVAQNGVIGRDGGMPWRLSTDLKRFKSLTIGKPVIMGRKTFESIGKALPGRLNVVISRSQIHNDDVIGVGSLEIALDIARRWAVENEAEQICIVGGGEIYRQALPLADRLYVTHILASPDGDVVFPEIEESKWRTVSAENLPITDKDTAETIFAEYERL